MLRSYHFVNAPFQQRLNPAGDALAVAIQECQHVSRCICGPNETCPHQTLSFVGADESHALQITDVVSKLGFQVAYFFLKKNTQNYYLYHKS